MRRATRERMTAGGQEQEIRSINMKVKIQTGN